jgi:hypothetical protein
MKQAQVNLEKGIATLPLRKGKLRSGELVWFVVTDTPTQATPLLPTAVVSITNRYSFTACRHFHALLL